MNLFISISLLNYLYSLFIVKHVLHFFFGISSIFRDERRSSSALICRDTALGNHYSGVIDSLSRANTINYTVTITCHFILEKEWATIEQFRLFNFTHKACGTTLYGLQAFSKGAAKLGLPTKADKIKNQNSTMILFKAGSHDQNAYFLTTFQRGHKTTNQENYHRLTCSRYHKKKNQIQLI